jgi:peptide/nickel transport system permease protein
VRAYLVKRLLLIPVTIIGITFITFGVMKLAPGDPSQMVRGQASGGNVQATQANVESLNEWKKERHLDKHWTVQYLYWLRDLCTFDLGRSFLPPRQRVSELILDRLPVTLVLNLISFFLIYLVAIPIGIVGAARQFTLWDRVTTIGVFLLYSLPAFWIGTLMLAFLCTPGGFPTTGYHGSTIAEIGFFPWIGKWILHGTLPVICMTYAGFAFLSRQMRSSLLEQIRQDFVRTARAKGLSERVVILRHACRNALIPIITLFGTLLPELISGAVIIEELFSIPGMGQQFFLAIKERDYPVIMGIETISALLTLVGILVSDLLYVAVNPAITYE